MELNWAGHFRSGTDGNGKSGPEPPWPTGPAGEQEVAPEPTDEWAEEPDNLPEDGEGVLDRDGATPRGPDSPGALAWLRQISFRGRVSALVAAAVGVAVAMAALASYVAVSGQMKQQAASSLSAATDSAPQLGQMGSTGPAVDPFQLYHFQQQWSDYVQVVTSNQVVSLQSSASWSHAYLPKSAAVKEALKAGANGPTPPFEAVTASDGRPYLVAAVPSTFPGVVVMVGFNLTNVDNTLAFLRLALILVAVGGVALAAALGWAVGRASMRPVEELTLAAERVAETQDLSEKIEDTSNDELGRLARSFNAMLGALAASRQQQAQLVSDAGHELRTPLTSLRTNIEVLMRTKDLPPADRDELLSDVDAQLQELATLVGDLVDLARDEERQETEPELVAFDQLVRHAVERAQRRAMSVHFESLLEPGYIRSQPAMLERAVVNVLDNAAKWSPARGKVIVRLWTDAAGWHLVVTDQGPGIPPEDLPHIFERFYRAASARSMPGSGLGLAIVKRVVTSHGGTIDVTCPPGGGTRVEVVLPVGDEVGGENNTPPPAESLTSSP
jgi:two-component system sensor histidine kinase MprB